MPQLENQALLINSSKNDQKRFVFDQVFLECSQQSTIFGEVESFVESGLNGNNVCIFAYGQTAAGKTYTMEGPPELFQDQNAKLTISNDSGILPRTAEFIHKEV